MQRTLLIVEDVETNATTLEMTFSALDVSVVTARSGEQAWRLLEDGVHDLAAVVTDLEMRGMDGFELIGRVRAHSVHRNVPIMVITGTSDPDAAERVHQLGANAFFGKPYSPTLVRQKMEQLLNHATP
jgi:CheY-like chemotaxis protein